MDEEKKPTARIGMRSGTYVDLLAPAWPKGTFKLDDIAWNLSGIPRFGASADPELFVSDHCIDVALLAMDDYVGGKCPERESDFDAVFELGRQALMHDAEEAYVGDVVSPFGAALSVTDGEGTQLPFRAFKSRMRRAIFEDLSISEPTEVAAGIIARCDLQSLEEQAIESMRACNPETWDCFKGVCRLLPGRLQGLRVRHRTNPHRWLAPRPQQTRALRYREFLLFAESIGLRA